jgi:hypothetical protein
MSLDVQLIEPNQSPAGALRAKALIKPLSGVANDYLCLFGDLVKMLERIPQTPELHEDLIVWRPIDHREHFKSNALPGRDSALEAYEALNPCFRRRFEALAEELNLVAIASVAAVRGLFHEGTPDDLSRVSVVCLRAGVKLRAILMRASRLVTYGNYFDG